MSRGSSTTRFLLARIFPVASIISEGDIGAGLSDESLADEGLARTQQRSIAGAGSARTALHPGGPAWFFTINEILDKSDRPAALPMPVPNDEPFGMTAFVQPEGPSQPNGMKYRSIWLRADPEGMRRG